MSEPIMRRTMSGGFVTSSRTPVSRINSPLGKALSLCSLLSVLALSIAPLTVQAVEPASLSSIESTQAQSSLLIDITAAGKRLVSVGERGHILYSDDNGSTWTQAKVPTRQLLTAVYFVDDKHGWAVGHDAQIIATTDGGQTWVKQFEDLSREAPLLDIWFKDAQTGFAVGAYGALLATTDGGANWEDISERMNNEDGYHLNAIVAVKDSGLFVVGELGVMFRSADWGQTWETVESPYDGSLFGAVATKEPAALLAYGLRGHLFRSTDFGTTWQQIEINTPNNGPLEFGLADGELLADGSIVVVGHGGTVLKSTDDGRTFSLVNRADRVSLSGAATTDNGKLILVGQGGIHVASPTGADLGQQ